MKTKMILMAVLLTAVVALAPAAYAQGEPVACNNRTVTGSYSVHCSGWTAAGPGGSLVPMIQVGVATGDTGGNWTGSATINIGGQAIIKNAPVSGKTILNPDCTGTITYNAGTPNELNISYVANPQARETVGVVTDKGTVMSCVLKKIK